MKLAIVKLSAMGDIIQAMVVLQFIKKYNEAIEIDWIVDEAYEGLLQQNEDICNVHIVKLKKARKNKSIFLLFSELLRLRKLNKYDMIIYMQGLIKSSIVAKFIPSSLIVGFDKKSAREGLSSLLYDNSFKIDYSKNVILRNVNLIENALELSISKENLYFKKPFLFPGIQYNLISRSSFKKNILLIPGSSSLSKCYPIKKYTDLTNLLDANFLVIWGNADEKKMGERIKKQSHNLDITICDKLSLENLISVVSQMDLIIGPDSGPTHMAWALNIPSIMLFGPTPGYRNTLSTRINKVIESDSKVNPLKINKHDTSIEDIEVNKIVNLANELLGE